MSQYRLSGTPDQYRDLVAEYRESLRLAGYSDLDNEGDWISYQIGPQDYLELWSIWRAWFPTIAPPPEPTIRSRADAQRALDVLLRRTEEVFGLPTPTQGGGASPEEQAKGWLEDLHAAVVRGPKGEEYNPSLEGLAPEQEDFARHMLLARVELLRWLVTSQAEHHLAALGAVRSGELAPLLEAIGRRCDAHLEAIRGGQKERQAETGKELRDAISPLATALSVACTSSLPKPKWSKEEAERPVGDYLADNPDRKRQGIISAREIETATKVPKSTVSRTDAYREYLKVYKQPKGKSVAAAQGSGYVEYASYGGEDCIAEVDDRLDQETEALAQEELDRQARIERLAEEQRRDRIESGDHYLE